MKKNSPLILVIFTINFLFSEYIDVQFASFSYTIGGSYGSCVKFKKAEYAFSQFNECSCAWAANDSSYPNCYDLFYDPQTNIIKYNLSEGEEYIYRNFSNDYTCHIYVEETEIPILECSEMDLNECSNELTCEWIEDFNNYSCSGFSQNQCYQYEGCDWTLSYGGSYGQWSHSCSGTYQVNDSYCQEIQMSECSDFMTESSCNHTAHLDVDCNWIENTETGSCSSLSLSVCDLPEYGSCYSDCTNWGNYYNGMFCYGTMYCAGGSYQSDNSYCEESEYQLGDLNQDSIINVQDIILTVNLVLNNEYNILSDLNSDEIVNVLDIVQVVNIILN